MEHETEAGRLLKQLLDAQTSALQHSTTHMAAAYETYIRGSSGSTSTGSRFSLISDGEGPPNGGVQRWVQPRRCRSLLHFCEKAYYFFGDVFAE